MANIIKFPKTNTALNMAKNNVTMTLTRNIKGLTVSVNLAKLTREELVQALMPLPSEKQKVDEIGCEKLALVKKYINQ